jgi:transposase
MAELPLQCPNYTLLSKRLAQLNIKNPAYLKSSMSGGDPVGIAIDSTGLKQYGRDEWHQEKHHVVSKASWRKLHLGVGDDHYIYASVLTDKNTMDYQVVETLCEQIQVEVNHLSADKMYDDNQVYETLENHFPQADVAIPPREDLYYDESHHATRCRNMIEIAAKGQIAWQRSHEYGKRNVSEMAMQRYKRTFGNRLHTRELANQKMETMIACGVLNRFTGFGMPQSYRSN